MMFFEWRSQEKGKNGPLGPWQTPSANIEHVGVYFAKMGCKIEDGFTDILGFQLLDIASGRRGVLLGLNSTRSTHKFCSQKKKRLAPFSHGAAISFLPLFWLYFNERIYEYGDKVKLMISWKSVDFKPQFWWKSVWKEPDSLEKVWRIRFIRLKKCRLLTSSMRTPKIIRE